MQSEGLNKTLLQSIKSLIRQYNSDINYVKNKSKMWKQKKYHPIKTRLSVFIHWFNHFIIDKYFFNKKIL